MSFQKNMAIFLKKKSIGSITTLQFCPKMLLIFFFFCPHQSKQSSKSKNNYLPENQSWCWYWYFSLIISQTKWLFNAANLYKLPQTYLKISWHTQQISSPLQLQFSSHFFFFFVCVCLKQYLTKKSTKLCLSLNTLNLYSNKSLLNFKQFLQTIFSKKKIFILPIF